MPISRPTIHRHDTPAVRPRRPVDRTSSVSASQVARQLWELVDRCIDDLHRSAARGGPTPEAHLAQLRREMLRHGHRTLRGGRRRESVDTVIALLRSQLDPRSEPPFVPLATPRTGRATAAAVALVRDLRIVEHVLRVAS